MSTTLVSAVYIAGKTRHKVDGHHFRQDVQANALKRLPASLPTCVVGGCQDPGHWLSRPGDSARLWGEVVVKRGKNLLGELNSTSFSALDAFLGSHGGGDTN